MADPCLSASQQTLIIITFFQPVSSVLPTGKHVSPKENMSVSQKTQMKEGKKKIKQAL